MFFANLTLVEFLSLLAAGSAATVALYLLIRARRRVVVPTLRFWQQAQRALEQKRRRRIDQPLSLLLQLLALAALLLAIAQPRLGPRPETGAWHVLLLDGSAWMQIPEVEADAKRQALRWLRSLPAHDSVQVVRADALPTPLTPFTTDREAAARAIRDSAASSTALDLAPAFELAAQALRLHASRPGEIVYAGPLYATVPEDVSPPPNLRLLVTRTPQPNVGFTRVLLRRSSSDPARVEAQAHIRNYGPAPRVVPFLAGFGGSIVASRTVHLPAHGDAAAAFEFRAPVAGWVDVRLNVQDALPSDDRARLELPAPPVARITVFTDNPAALRPLLESDPRMDARYVPVAQYDPATDADVVILDSFHPARLPLRPALLVRPGQLSAQITAWNAAHPVSVHLRSPDVRLEAARTLAPERGDAVLAATPQGPVALARDGEPRRVLLGFHPGEPSLRYHVSAPLLFAGILRWLAPAKLHMQEVLASAPGVVTLELPETAPPERVRVSDGEGEPLPFSLEGRMLRCFAPSPSEVRISTPAMERVYSLSLPALAPSPWEPPAGAARGAGPAAASPPGPRDLWQWLVLLGCALMAAEWALFRLRPAGRLSPALKAAAILAALAALAEPGLPVKETKMAVSVLVDTSASISAQGLRRASEILSSLEQARGRHLLRLMPFARSVRPPAPDEAAPAWKLRATAGEAGRATQIEGALREAVSSSPPGLVPRIVLISDGRENSGWALRAAWQARELGIPVDTFLVAGRPAPKLRLESARMPSVAFTGERFPVSLSVHSPEAAPAELEILAEGKTIGKAAVQLQPGENQLSVRASVSTPGAIDLQLRLQAGPLGEASLEQAVSVRRPRVLYLTQDPPGMERNLLATLSAAQFDVTVSGALPADGLESYQILVLNNFDFEALPFAVKERLERFVQQGGGLLVIGGERNVYVERKQPESDPLQRALPATIAPPRTPEGSAVILIVDKSSSMEGRKMELARLAAIGVVENLKPVDQIGILIFDNTHQWAVPLRRAEDKTMIKRLIAGIVADGGTQIAPALAEAYKRMLPAQGVYKHIVLLTDGISEEGDSMAIARDAAQNHITISTVGLGQDVNRGFLERIAVAALGKAYFLTDPSGLEQILIKDVMEHTGSTTVERPFRPRILRQAEILSGLPQEAIPELRGYVRFTAKPAAETLLAIPAQPPSASGADPLLVRWQYGLGRAAVFASDAKPRWAAQWIPWNGFDRFWANVLRDLLPQAQPGQATLSHDPARGVLLAEYRHSAAVPLPGEAPTLYAFGPDGFRRAVRAEKLAPGLFQAVIPVGARRGLFRVRPLEESRAFPEIGLYLPEPELSEYGENPALLRQISAYSGGRYQPQPPEVFHPGGRSIPTRLRLWPGLIVLALLLNYAEVLLRRLRRGMPVQTAALPRAA
ncbi:MAG: VWA domain-containing protein [Bryobacteraceae bacterium]